MEYLYYPSMWYLKRPDCPMWNNRAPEYIEIGAITAPSPSTGAKNAFLLPFLFTNGTADQSPYSRRNKSHQNRPDRPHRIRPSPGRPRESHYPTDEHFFHPAASAGRLQKRSLQSGELSDRPRPRQRVALAEKVYIAFLLSIQGTEVPMQNKPGPASFLRERYPADSLSV